MVVIFELVWLYSAVADARTLELEVGFYYAFLTSFLSMSSSSNSISSCKEGWRVRLWVHNPMAACVNLPKYIYPE